MENEKKYYLKYPAEEIEGRLEKAGKAVLFTPQELTPAEQAQARANTGAVSAEEVIAIVDAKISSITNAEEVAY